VKEAELQLKTRKQEFDEWLAVQKLAQDSTLRRYQIDAQFKAGFTADNMTLDAEADIAAMEGALRARKQAHDEKVHADKMDLEHRKLDQAAAMQSADHSHEADLQENELDAAPAPAQAQGE
jgi:hypothetical protein